MKPQLLQEASQRPESGAQAFCCDEAGQLLLGQRSPGTDAALLGLLLLEKQQEPWRGALI